MIIRDNSRIDTLAAALKRLGAEIADCGYHDRRWRACVRVIGTTRSVTCYSVLGLADALAPCLAALVAPKGAI